MDHAANALELDSILADKELYKEMIEILQSFDDNIIGVTALKSERDFFSVEYMILTQNHQKALPITAYGDGMKKALLLLSVVVNAKDGILLLDEFETAIHTSAMDAVFSWLLKSAIRLNVQVFLTSHSEEAIQKVLRCSEELQEYINLYTLYDFNGKNYVRMLGCQEAINANDNKCQTAIQELTGEWGAYYMVRNHNFYSTAALAPYAPPTFTTQANGCVATVNYTYHTAWTKAFAERVIAGYDDVMRLIRKDGTDFAKILKFHDWIVKNVAYSQPARRGRKKAGTRHLRHKGRNGRTMGYQVSTGQEIRYEFYTGRLSIWKSGAKRKEDIL